MRNLAPLFEAMQAPELYKKYEQQLSALIAKTPALQPKGDSRNIGFLAQELFANVCDSDPTGNVTPEGEVKRVGTYTPWLLDRLVAGELDARHLQPMSVLLQAFDQHRSEIPEERQRNIQVYKSVQEFYQVAHPLVDIRDERAKSKQSKAVARKEEYVRRIPVNEGWQCWAPLTAEKAKQLGCSYHAEWCTAGSSEWKQRFKQYVINNHSALFILEGPDGEVYQTHLDSVRGDQRYAVMNNRENKSLDVEVKDEIRQASGFSYELQVKYTDELAPLIQNFWAKKEGETSADTSSQWRNLVLLTAFHPQHPRVRDGNNMWLSLDNSSVAAVRNFTRLSVEEQNQRLRAVTLRLNVTGVDTLATILEGALDYAEDADRDTRKKLKYLIYGLQNSFDDIEDYRGPGEMDDEVPYILESIIGDAKNRDEVLALLVACINNSDVLRKFLAGSPLGFNEAGVQQLLTAFNTDAQRSRRDVQAFCQHVWQRGSKFTRALGMWALRLSEQYLESGVYNRALHIVTSILNMRKSETIKDSYGEGERRREFEVQVFSTEVNSSSEAVRSCTAAGIRHGHQNGAPLTIKHTAPWFFHTTAEADEDGEGGGEPLTLLDLDVDLDLDNTDGYADPMDVDEQLHFAVHEMDVEFDAAGEPSLHMIWHAIEQSGENMEAKIKKAVELVDFGAGKNGGGDETED